MVALAACQRFAAIDEAKVYRLMECEECVSGELDSVLAIGRGAVPLLARLLRYGPPADRRETVKGHLATAWERSRNYGLIHGYVDSVPSESLYVETYLDNYVANYQIRAARALGRLGGEGARSALQLGPVDPARPSVMVEIQYALDSLWQP